MDRNRPEKTEPPEPHLDEYKEPEVEIELPRDPIDRIPREAWPI